MNQIDSQDAHFLFLENTDSPSHITLLYIYDQSELSEPVRYKNILTHVENRLHSAPVFYRRVKRVPMDIDFPYWVDDKSFDLEYHVRHMALPTPGDWRQLCIQVSRLHSRPLDVSKPLWEMYVIEGLNNVEGFSPGAFAIVTKIHHCAMDEFTALELFESLHEVAPNEQQHLSKKQYISHPVSREPNVLDALVSACGNNALRLTRLGWSSLTNMRGISKFAARKSLGMLGRYVDGSSLRDAPTTRFSGELTPHRVFDGIIVSSAAIDKLVETVNGATRTHVAAVICGAALGKYLAHHGEAVKDASLVALLQVNDRVAEAHAMIGNHISLDSLKLHTQLLHPVDRLHAIVSTSENVGCRAETEERRVLMRKVFDGLPSSLLALSGKHSKNKRSPYRQLFSSGNCTIAEMDGSEVPLYMLGARLVTFGSLSPLYDGCGIRFNMAVYDGTTNITFTADRSMLPDPELMRQCLIETYEEIEAALKETK